MSILKEFVIRRVEEYFNKNEKLVNTLYKLRFNKDFNLEDLYCLEKAELYSFCKELEIKIAEINSCISIKHLARCIQRAHASSIGCSSMTNYTCKKCGKEEVYSSTVTPLICMECATKIAENLVKIILNS